MAKFEDIGDEEREGKGKDLLGVWLGGNMDIRRLVRGRVRVRMGVDVFWSMGGIIMGRFIGGIFMGCDSGEGGEVG
uniref:cytosine permease n=1 Tax=Bacillus velezensis TaxID=492670 RepID=UPI0016439670